MAFEDESFIEIQSTPDATTEAAQPDQNSQQTTQQIEPEDPEYASLLDRVQEIRKNSDVVGYILKGDSKATVDLDDPSKIIDYAMLSSQAFESAVTITSTFNLGTAESVLVEGKTTKVLCVDLGQNKISLFMDKTADHAEFLNLFAPQLAQHTSY